MTRILDIRIASSGRLDGLRRIEYLLLLLGCTIGMLWFQPVGMLLALPLLLLALAMVPGKEVPQAKVRGQRQEVLNKLSERGLELRTQWARQDALPLDDATAEERGTIQREVTEWLSECNGRLARYPEIAGIVKASQGSMTLPEDMDRCLEALSRVRRLLALSDRLNLPI